MRCKQVFAEIGCLRAGGNTDSVLSKITNDSRAVEPGSLFVAINGSKYNGHDFIRSAIERGASAVVFEEPGAVPHVAGAQAWALVNDARRALSRASHVFYGRPSHHMRLVGVTGTNGKTTVTYMLESIIKAAGHSTGVVGTVGNRIRGEHLPTSLTTPLPPDLHSLLARMVRQSVDYAFIEASSEGLSGDRLSDCEFDVGVLTNITRDHFNTHGSYEGYVSAKMRLFQALGQNRHKDSPSYAVANAEDPAIDRVRKESAVPVFTFAVEQQADAMARHINLSPRGTELLLDLKGKELHVNLPYPGMHNVYNALAAALVACIEGVSPGAIVEGLSHYGPVPGRWESIREGQPFGAIVDFAHNPDALLKALKTAALWPGRRILVFGCEGNKDRGKRPLMGEIAALHADYFAVTSDNPHTEDPQSIIDDIVRGVEGLGKDTLYEAIPDRREAIKRALTVAGPGDVVIVAGKGHETHIVVGPKSLPFDDRQVVRDLLREAGYFHRSHRQRTPLAEQAVPAERLVAAMGM